MNPHDPARRPGAHAVTEEFGVEDPWKLSDGHPFRDPLDLVGRMVAEAARDVDELHGELTRAAQSAIELLEPIGRGEHAGMRGWYGILRTAGPQIELLVARRGAAYEHLTRAMSTYHRLLPEPDTALALKAPGQNLGPAPEHESEPGRDDDWAIADGRQLAALQAVEAGGLRFHQSAVYGDTWLCDGEGNRPKVLAETAERLMADGLLEKDASTSLYRPGQLLSLTPHGETALQDARTAAPRVSAALSRSHPASAPGVAVTDTAPVSLGGTASKPSRSR
ncbi:large ATP-binding protein [Streptomyces sp. SID13666]|uniref:large ATP-binding protein n=1 Tax=unclassified Streptomyces TaxID=2593676 RepID=UPI0013C24342|nr:MULTISPECIES: large ATP-binding protein [unclassified Streptomyces]NEA56596.1 large ATP-binding protein [Streptomyces sp. SID13666]NEA73040.1 large ATP-binding protein [Streptomyces sp. SID13588]